MDSRHTILNSSLSHFLLMFGYKLFAAYFPLYLIEQGLSNPKIGYTYLLIYLPLAIFSPVVGGLLHKVSTKILSSLGIFGYGLYSLGLLIDSPQFFYPLQVLLGVSSALFFVSYRVVIMRAKTANYDTAFGWFYSAPLYSQFAATAVGALVIFYFGFPGVFLASFTVHILNLFLNSTFLAPPQMEVTHEETGLGKRHTSLFKEIFGKYILIFKARGGAVPYIIVGFVILLVESCFATFFLAFLKDLGWARPDILLYSFVLAGLNVLLSIFVIGILRRGVKTENILHGGLLYGLGAIVIALVTPVLNLFGVAAINGAALFGGLTVGSARSGMMARAYQNEFEEAGSVDTILSPLAHAIGAFAGGFIILWFGYQALFVGGGVLVLLVVGIVGLISRKVA